MLSQHHQIRPLVEAVHAERLHQAEGRGSARRRPPRSLDEIVVAAANGEQTAWKLLVERFTRRIGVVARRHRLSSHDAEDIAQTTWLRLVEHIHSLREPAGVGGWLETSAARESLRVIKHHAAVQPTNKELRAGEAAEEPIEARLERNERRVALAGALERLPENPRRLMRMFLAEPATSYAEISAELDIRIGSIGPTRQRQLERLRSDERLARVVGPDASR